MAKYTGPTWFVGTGYTTISNVVASLALFTPATFEQYGELDQLDSVDANTFEFSVGANYKITISYVSDDDVFADATFQVQIYNTTGAAIVEAFDFPLVDSVFNAGTAIYILEAVTGRDYDIRVITPTAAADVKFTVGFERLD